jgi:hypothetical protein
MHFILQVSFVRFAQENNTVLKKQFMITDLGDLCKMQLFLSKIPTLQLSMMPLVYFT